MHRNRKRHHAVHALATNVNCNLMIDASTSLGTRGFTRTVSCWSCTTSLIAATLIAIALVSTTAVTVWPIGLSQPLLRSSALLHVRFVCIEGVKGRTVEKRWHRRCGSTRALQK